MALTEFRRIQVKDEELNKVQASIEIFTRQLDKTFLDGIILKDVLIGTSTTLIETGIARAYQGFFIIDNNSDSRVWRDATSTADNTKFLPLKASSATTVSLWVF